MTKRRLRRNRRPLIESLEPRMLLSGSLIYRYDFDANGGLGSLVSDVSGFGTAANGTIVAPGTWNSETPDKSLFSADFRSGTAQMTFSPTKFNAEIGQNSNAITVAWWMKLTGNPPPGTSGSKDEDRAFVRLASGSNGFAVGFPKTDPVTNSNSAYTASSFRYTVGVNANGTYTASSSGPYDASTWLLTAVTYSTSSHEASLYTGRSFGTLALGATWTVGAAQAAINDVSATSSMILRVGSKGAPGLYDDLRVYSGVLSLSELQALEPIATVPTGLSATAVTPRRVDLAWTDRSDNETGFSIERSVSGGSFTAVAALPAGTTAYSFTDLEPATAYVFRVRATNTGGASAPSDTASATTPAMTLPTPPSQVEAAALGTSSIRLTWNDLSVNEMSFVVERSSDGSAFSPVGSAGVNTGSFTDSGLVEGKTYSYRVGAYNEAGTAWVASTATASTVLTVPSNLRGTAPDFAGVSLSWVDQSTTETLFRIERSSDGGGTFPVSVDVAAGTTTYSDTSVTEGGLYSYRLRSQNLETTSAWTYTVDVAVPLRAPTDLVATPAFSGAVDLAWSDLSAHETGYRVERSLNGADWTAVTDLPAGSAAYTDSAAPAASLYYRVRPLGDHTSVSVSNTATSVPLARGSGVLGQYYSGSNFNTLVLTRTDPQVAFSWSGGSPGTGVPNDNFSARWTGQVQARFTETYTFTTSVDDWVLGLWVNGVSVIPAKKYGSFTGSIAMVAGQKVDLRFDFAEIGGGAGATLSWQSASQAKEAIPTQYLYLPAGQDNAPRVSLVAPQAGRLYTSDQPITLVADVRDAEPNVTLVEFLDGSTVLGTSTGAPFRFEWSNPAHGSHSLTVRATDAGGNVVTSAAVSWPILGVPVQVNFQPSSSAVPSGYVKDKGDTYKAQNGYTYGWSVSLSDYPETGKESNLNADQRYDTQVYMRDNTSQGGGYGVWEVALPNGGYLVHAVTGDQKNAANALPMILDIEGVRVISAKTSTTAPFAEVSAYAWVTDGKLTLSSGGYNTPLCFVDITPADMAPSVVIASPLSEAQLDAGSLVVPSVSVADIDGTVEWVELWVDGTKVSEDRDLVDGLALGWVAAGIGSHRMTIRAGDDAGTVGEASTAVYVRSAGNVPPAVSLTAPAAGQVFTFSSYPATSIPIAASATDTDGSIQRVEFFRSDPFYGSVKLGEDTTSPFAFTWSNSTLTGSFDLWARAWDQGGAYTDSLRVPIVVNAKPTVSLGTPNDGRVYGLAGEAVHMIASPTDTDGTIASVAFYVDGSLAGTDTDGSNGWSFTPALSVGQHYLKVIATDNNGGTGTDGSVITIADRTPILDAASYLGGTGSDFVKEAEIQADGTIVLGANIGNSIPGGVSPTLLGSATSASAGAILRLTNDGKTILSVTRLAAEVADVSIDAAGNIYVAARAAGVMKLDPLASRVLWTQPNGGTADRLDVAPDGTCIVLKDAEEYVGTGGSKLAYLYDPAGNLISTIAGKYNRVYDVAIHGPSQTVYLVGFSQQTMAHNSLPVQAAYIKATDYLGVTKWVNYDWQTSTENYSGFEADTRALRASIGADGKLYVLFNAAGGNHIFTRDPQNHSLAVGIVGGDAYHTFYNSGAEHKTFFARFEPTTGAYLLGQQLTARLPDGSANTLWGELGNIKADDQGRVYFTGASASYAPYTLNPIADTEYGAGPVAVVMSSDFTRRLLLARTSSSGYMHTVAVRTLAGRSDPTMVVGGYTQGSAWTVNAVQGASGGGNDGVFAVISAAQFFGGEVIVDNASSGASLSGAWSSATNANDFDTNYVSIGAGSSASATFTPVLSQAGDYEVYGWWVTPASPTTSVPYDVTHRDGTTRVLVNQQNFPGQWVYLGTFPFAGGSAGNVTIRTPGSGSTTVVADAVKCVPLRFVAPGAAEQLSAAIPPAAVDLSWAPPGGGEVVLVERSTDGVNYQLLGQPSGAAGGFTDPSAPGAGVTVYRVTRKLGAAVSAPRSFIVASLSGLTLTARADGVLDAIGPDGLPLLRVRSSEVAGITFQGTSGDDSVTLNLHDSSAMVGTLRLLGGGGSDSLTLDGVVRSTGFEAEGWESLVITGNSDIPLAGSHLLGRLELGSGSQLTLTGTETDVLDVTTLVKGANAVLDLGAVGMIVRSGDFGVLQQWAAEGAAAAWRGTGLRSALAGGGSLNSVGIGVAGDLGLDSFSGRSLAAGDVIVRMTLQGDADLNGVVDLDDLFRLIDGFAAQGPGSVSSWSFGDFDWNGTVDLDDLFLLIDGYQAL